MGIKMKMVTGDHVAIAKTISGDLTLDAILCRPVLFWSTKTKDRKAL